MRTDPRPVPLAARGPRLVSRAALLAGALALVAACGDDATGGDAGRGAAAHDDRVEPSTTAPTADGPRATPDATAPDLAPSADDPAPAAAAHEAALLELLASCRDRERRLVSEAAWAAARDAPGTLALRLPEPRDIETLTAGELRLDALLLVSAPDASQPRMLARLGDTLYSAFTRPDPALYAELMAELHAAAR